MTPPDALPTDQAAPGESQAEYEQRIGQTQPAASAALAAPAAPAAPDVPVGSLAQGAPGDETPPAMDITHAEPLLAQGAVGEPVEKLVRLLAAAGYATNSVVNATNPHAVLDATVMADVQRLWADHPEAREPDELFAGREGGVQELRGSWIGPHTWQTLYNLTGKGS